MTRSNIIRDYDSNQNRFIIQIDGKTIGYVESSSDSNNLLAPIAEKLNLSIKELRAHIVLSEHCFPIKTK